MILRRLGFLDIVGADLVEVAPAYDHADITVDRRCHGAAALSRLDRRGAKRAKRGDEHQQRILR